jgi:putative ABC transport system substrate-binding protein
MTHRTGGILVALALLMPPSVGAQQPARMFQIGFLETGSLSTNAQFLDAFRQALRELAYVEGKHFRIESRLAEGRPERLPDLAADLARLKVDVILTQGTPPTRAATQATKTIPIVMLGVPDPVVIGLVASLARPGGNITGLSNMVSELSGKRLELLKEAVPGASRIAVLSNPTNPGTIPQLRETEAAARSLRVQLHPVDVGDPTKFDAAFSRMTRGRADALVVLGDPMIFGQRRQLAKLAARSRLPAIFHRSEFAEEGGFMAYGGSLREEYRRAATYVDKILKGANPADLPVEQPTRFGLVINLKTAKALGLTIPQSVLIRATQVIQ